MSRKINAYQKYAEKRDSLGLSDYRVSKGAGVSKSRFSDWKNGKSIPNVYNMAKIARFMGVPADFFLGGEE